MNTNNMRFAPHCALLLVGIFFTSFMICIIPYLLLGKSPSFMIATLVSVGFTVIFFLTTNMLRNFDQDFIYSGKPWFPKIDKHGHRLPEIFNPGLALVPPWIRMTEKSSIKSFPISGKVSVMATDNRTVLIPFKGQASVDPLNPYSWFLIEGPHENRVEVVTANTQTSIQGTIDSNADGTSLELMNDEARDILLEAVHNEYNDDKDPEVYYDETLGGWYYTDPLPEGRKIEMEYGIQLGRINLGDMSLTEEQEKFLAAAQNNKDIDREAEESVIRSKGTLSFLDAKKMLLLQSKTVPGNINIDDLNINAPQGGSDIMSVLGMAKKVMGDKK